MDGTAYIRLGSYRIPSECLGPCNLNEENGSETGTFVRVHLRNLGTVYGPNVVSPPTYLDFRGAEAQEIRRWFSRMEQTSNVTVITGGEEEPETKTRAAGKAAA
jgi:hypothetical protein